MRFYAATVQKPHTKHSLNLISAHRIGHLFPPLSIPQRVYKFLSLHELSPPKFEYPLFTSFPPWLSPEPTIDFHFTLSSKKDYSTTQLKTLFRERLATVYADHTIIYTDGSKSSHGVGAAITTNLLTKQFRLPDYSTVFSAELLALKEGIKIAITLPNNTKFIIASDSLSALKSIKSLNLKYAYIRQIIDLLYISKQKNRQISLLWIPSHMGIPGNEKADNAAKSAPHTQISTSFENSPSDFHSLLDRIKTNQFQLHWDTIDPNNKLWEFKKNVLPPLHFQDMNRSDNVLLRRLAAGHTFSTHSHLLKGDPAPLCTSCGSSLSVKHWFEANHYLPTRNKYNLPSNIEQIVNNYSSHHVNIAKYLSEIRVSI